MWREVCDSKSFTPHRLKTDANVQNRKKQIGLDYLRSLRYK